MNPIALLIVFALGFGAAWNWQGSRADARAAALDVKQTHAVSDALAVLAGRYQGAEINADRIQKAGEVRAAALEDRLQETQHALKTATRHRPCLGGPALRLLGQSPGLRLAPAEPAPAGPLYGGPGAAAADSADEGEYATDTDIADWIAVAGKRYEQCRASLRDIRQWEVGP